MFQIKYKLSKRIYFKNVSAVRINLPLFSTVLPSNSRLFLSCSPFVVITTFSTGLVDVEVTSVNRSKSSVKSSAMKASGSVTLRHLTGELNSSLFILIF